MKKIYHILSILLLTTVLSGCETGRYSDLLGRWERIAIVIDNVEYNVRAGEWECYVFYEDGTGIYKNDYEGFDFYWDDYSHERLHIRYSDGVVDDLYYRFNNGDLELSPTRSFYNGSIYRYTGRRY